MGENSSETAGSAAENLQTLSVIAKSSAKFDPGNRLGPRIGALGNRRRMNGGLTGLLHHSDRGSQYACGIHQHMLADHGIVRSMSRVGNCYDNAVMVSFWGTLKTECVYPHGEYATLNEARQSIFDYIETFYNRTRRHSSLGYISPEAFEAAAN